LFGVPARCSRTKWRSLQKLLKEAGRSAELGGGSLYLKLQKKMTENFKIESLETLREWVMQESQFYTIAHETVRGLIKG